MSLTAFFNACLDKQKHPIKGPPSPSPLPDAQPVNFFKLVPSGEFWHFLKASKQ